MVDATEPILENVHDHGSGSCIVRVGEIRSAHVIEVYEKNGGFDLNKLPKGEGGWGYNAIVRSKCSISHSPA